ncbi:MAG: hypothetical protein J6Y72_10360 [Bacteroidales bacterium]|jgi:hypothetical protein|nr:hypothetical protein [Bacteroidales bacterium]MBP5420198.1 hypothetical protein [Bacteroidales bacterium]
MLKGKSKITASLIGSLLFIIVWSACNSADSALLSYQHTIQVGLYSCHTQNDTTLTNVQVRGIGVDSLLYDEDELGELFLNINMNADVTRFMLSTQTLNDEMTITYTKSLESVGGSGIAMEVRIDSIGCTNTFIDSVSIVNKYIRYNESSENVQIFIY